MRRFFGRMLPTSFLVAAIFVGFFATNAFAQTTTSTIAHHHATPASCWLEADSQLVFNGSSDLGEVNLWVNTCNNTAHVETVSFVGNAGLQAFIRTPSQASPVAGCFCTDLNSNSVTFVAAHTSGWGTVINIRENVAA